MDLSSYYPMLKTTHVVCVILWVIAQIALLLCCIAHQGALKAGRNGDCFTLIEIRILRFVINPTMILGLVIGGLLTAFLGKAYLAHAGWLKVKLLAVFILTAFHGLLIVNMKRLQRNELADDILLYGQLILVFVLTGGIIFLALAKPF